MSAVGYQQSIRFLGGICIVLLVVMLDLIYFNGSTPQLNRKGMNVTVPQFKKYQARVCSLDFLRNYFVKTGRFFGGGKWVNDKWWPKDCMMPKYLSPEQLAPCLVKKNIKKIGQVGDSQSMRYMAAIKRGENAYSCKLLKSESTMSRSPAPSYFSPPLDPKSIRVASRDCSGCAGQLVRCTPQGSTETTDIEVLITEYTKDHEISTKRNAWKHECDDRLKNISGIFCQESMTTQEVYFREYWALSGYPDVIIIYAVHAHEAQKRRPSDFRRDFTWFIDLVVSVVPKTTKILYWNSPQVNSAKQPVFWRNITANTYISQLNAVSASVIKKFIIEKKVNNLYPMFDLYGISRDVMKWIVDGVHFSGPWYNQIITLFWTTLCAD
ncbi:uncharacterized protein LOC106151491 [Lingula anatina]|uniref:Uncharacterized protein LOC106151491 n=1 Tax=Lingula anatina TaxID=7574 RepID=A0A1S3H2K2_LINAN|nr:uncharacterized protein LOC106151491 [Lingula anatina]XP_013380243.1 uncharacterized protein LOC106151491 [Lingula anatina]XP_013380252.1 uncharacterized protein LOC106151491 [Lingula anatina]|eukprot:XP_013380234.1 uncharacterized protein LOC106151491 [Lingula anatina]